MDQGLYSVSSSGSTDLFLGARREMNRCFVIGASLGGMKRDLATNDALDAFLAQVERRAYKTALYTVQDHHAALDIVQNAMLKLSERYADNPEGEWPMLFQRILHNAIMDHHRRARVRGLWVKVMAPFHDRDGDEGGESLESLAAADESRHGMDPVDAAEGGQILAVIEDAIAQLPLRQRQAFLLRYWEEMDIAEAARVMGCSEGSIKTHSHRAIKALAKTLKAKGVTL